MRRNAVFVIVLAIVICLLSIGTLAAQSYTWPPSGLVGWWPGEGNANDIIGGNNGTCCTAKFTPGKVGQAFDFSGSLDRVIIPSRPDIDFTAADDYSIEFWLKTPQHNNVHPALVEKWNEYGCYPYPYSIRLGTPTLGPVGSVQAMVYDSRRCVFVKSNTRVDDNQWHHVAAVYRHSQKTIEIYIDGALDVKESYSGELGNIANGQPVALGIRPSPSPLSEAGCDYDGLLDEVSIYNRGLTADEIGDIFRAGAAGKYETTFDRLIYLTRQWTTDPNIAHALVVKLQAGQAANLRGNNKAKSGALKAYVNQLSAQEGKVITTEQVATLKFLAAKL